LAYYFKEQINAPDTEAINTAKDTLIGLIYKLKTKDIIKGDYKLEEQNIAPHPETSIFGEECKIECTFLSQCLHGIFNNDNLALNIKKLEGYYQKKITPD
jgi:hypothetical protein